MAMTSPVIATMVIYLLAPPTLLEYCDTVQAEAHALLPDTLEEGNLVATPDGHNLERARLRKLDERKLRTAHYVWSMSKNTIWLRIVSFCWLFTTLRLLYDYYAMLQDLKRLRHRAVIDTDDELHVSAVIVDSPPEVTVEAAEVSTARVAGCIRGNVDGE